MQMTSLIKITLAIILVFIGMTTLNPVMAYAQADNKVQKTDVQSVKQLLAHLKKTNPDLTAQYEKEKKEFEKWEKDLGKNANNMFNDQIDKVFGKNKMKASDVLGYIKAGEAIAAGDFDSAGKFLTGILTSCPPSVFGCYMEAWKGTQKFADKSVKEWAAQLYKTKSHDLFLEDFSMMSGPIYYDVISMRVNRHMEDKNWRYPVYVPSYMITYLRANKQIGDEISGIYDAMIKHEDDMFQVWVGNIKGPEGVEGAQTHFEALRCLREDCQKANHSWWQFGTQGERASQWRVVFNNDLGANTKLTAERQMFNHFLYRQTATKKQEYMRAFRQYYLSQILKQASKKEKARTDAQIAAAMRNAIAGMRAAKLKQAQDAASEKEKAELEKKQAVLAKYRKYLDDGLTNNTIHLPMGITADAAFQIGLKAVEYKKDYYQAIDNLNTLALQQAESRKRAEQAAKDNEERENDATFEPEEQDPPAGEEWIEEAEDITATPSLVNPGSSTAQINAPPSLMSTERRQCLMTYDFSNHNQEPLLALLPDEIRANSSGENVRYLLGLIGEICKPGYMEPEETDGDDWDDADEDLTASALTEEEKWAMRDELAAKSKEDAARSENKFNRQYSSIESQRREEARIAAEKARKRAEAFAAIAQGLGEMAAQIQKADRQNEAYSQQNLNSFATSGLAQQADDRYNFMKSCVNNRPSTPGFKSFDPNADRIACGENYRVQQNGTAGRGNTYDERLARQKQDAVRKRKQEQLQAAENRKAAINEAKNRTYAKKQCACYRAGKSAGTGHWSRGENPKNSQMNIKHPSNCPPSIGGMGSVSPWRRGYFNGKYNKVDAVDQRYVDDYCKYGT